MTNLTHKKCVPCEGTEDPLSPDLQQDLLKQVPTWSLNNNGHLINAWKFKDFKQAWNFVDQISELAESEGHHPNISFTWGKVEIELWTHAIDGLSENDFILAAKINQTYSSLS